MRETRVIVVTELYHPEDAATAFFTTGIAEGLAAEWPVIVICGQPGYHQRGCRSPWFELRNNVQIHRCFSTCFNKDVIPLRLLNAVSFCVSTFFCLLRLARPADVVFVGSNPPFLIFVVWLARVCRRYRFVARVEDIYPDVLGVLGVLRPSGFLYRMMRAAVGHVLRQASAVVVLGRDMRERVLSGLLDGARKLPEVRVIPNWGEEELLELPPERAPAVGDVQIPGRLVVLVAGNLGRVQDIETVVNAARLLTDEANIHFLIVGSGAKRRWLEEQVERDRLRNVTLLGQFPRREQRAFISASSIGIVPLLPCMVGISVPSRTYNLLAAGRPVIALLDPDSEIARMLEETRSGWCIEPGNAGKLADLLSQLAHHPEVVRERGENGRRAIVDRYNKQSVFRDYSELVQAFVQAT